MKRIQLFSEETSPELVFVNAFQPSECHTKADIWYPVYRLNWDGSDIQFAESFTGRFWTGHKKSRIVFETYTNMDFKDIEYESDVKLRLLLIDFEEKIAAAFSKLKGGRFEDVKLNEDCNIVYIKRTASITAELEVHISQLDFTSLT